jgi:hypothetical protein
MTKQEIEKRIEECKTEYYRCSRMICEQLSEDGHEIDIMEALDCELQHLYYELEKVS